ncbi:MAG TPA: hypothetical protein VG477_11990 [Thermoanaerobaculia bacterium]|nr:hypothetical protein [Thermoanaerobaculia bacterium]
MLLQVFRELFPVFVALYLVDAVAYVRRSRLLFARRPLGGWALKGPGVRLASLWPGDFAFLAAGSSLFPARDGVWLLDPQAGAAPYDPANWTLISYADPVAPRVDDDEARALADLLKELRRLDPAQRGRRIDALRDAAFDLKALKVRLDTVRRKTAVLRGVCLAFFLVLRGVLPGVLYLSPSPSPFLGPALAVAGVFYLAALGTAFATARGLRRSGISPPGGALVSMIFSPSSCAHAASSLCREALRGFDVLTAAALLLPREDLLRRVRADLHGAACAESRGGDPDWRRHWAERRRRVLGLLEEAGIDPGTASIPPERRDSAAASYCPICETESLPGVSDCAECGLPLVPFTASL